MEKCWSGGGPLKQKAAWETDDRSQTAMFDPLRSSSLCSRDDRVPEAPAKKAEERHRRRHEDQAGRGGRSGDTTRSRHGGLRRHARSGKNRKRISHRV